MGFLAKLMGPLAAAAWPVSPGDGTRSELQSARRSSRQRGCFQLSFGFGRLALNAAGALH